MAAFKLTGLLVLGFVATSTASTVKYHNVTLTSLQPAKLTVNVSFNTGGFNPPVYETPSPCLDMNLSNPCLPVLYTGNATNGLRITYAPKASVTFPAAETVQLKLCFSNQSTLARPWRAGNNLIGEIKQCPYVIKQGLNNTGGNYTWMPINSTIPIATYFVRAYVLAKSTDGIDTPVQTAYGQSVGFFQVQPAPGLPTSLKIAVGCCIPIGPVFLALYMIYDLKFRKKMV